MDILQSQVNSGWIYPVDVVTDPKAFRQSGQGFVIPLKAGHLPGEIQRIEPASIPATILELSRSLGEDITRISGVNEELLGAATDDMSGILSALRQGAGLITLQKIFDKCDYSQRLYGKIRLEAICNNFSKGKIAFILGKEPSPRFFTAHSLKYSTTVEEGNFSATQRQFELQQLLHFKQLGMPIPDKSILSAAFITNKRKVMEDMKEQAEQQAQAQQAQQQAEAQAQQADSMLKMAKAQTEVAHQQELITKSEENKAQAEHRLLESDLNLVKLAMELEDVQFNQIREAFDLAQAMKIANQSQPSQGGVL